LSDDLSSYHRKTPLKNLNAVFKKNLSINILLKELEDKKSVEVFSYQSGISINNQINLSLLCFQYTFLKSLTAVFLYFARNFIFLIFLYKFLKKFYKLAKINFNFLNKLFKIFVTSFLVFLNIVQEIIF
jgi:hypothetical protein